MRSSYMAFQEEIRPRTLIDGPQRPSRSRGLLLGRLRAAWSVVGRPTARRADRQAAPRHTRPA